MPISYFTVIHSQPGLYRRLAYSEYLRQRLRHRNNRNRETYLVNSNMYPYYNGHFYTTYSYPTHSTNTTNATHNTNTSQTTTNTDDNLLHNLVKNTIVKVHDIETIECPICLEPIKKNKDIIRNLSCTHYYHIECIDHWILNNPKCPLCRKNV